MNVLTLLRSVEELLYEVMSWLIFYPITLWRTLTRPIKTMRYSDDEQRDKVEKQYLETLSPPLFLVLSILLAHALELALGFHIASSRNPLGQIVYSNDQTLLAFRALIFSLPALLYAALSLHLEKKQINRDSLRAPFFSQCYISGTTAIIVSFGFGYVRLAGSTTTLIGITLVIVATLWYLWVQWRWLRQETALSRLKVTLFTGATFCLAMAITLGTGFLIAS